MCAPVGIRVVATVATIRHWRITKADVKTAFHKTGKADCDVFVVPPRECKDKRHYWLLQVATYGLVNSNAKFRDQSDKLIMDIGFSHLSYIPQLFYLKKENVLQMTVIKILDDLLICREEVVNLFLQ